MKKRDAELLRTAAAKGLKIVSDVSVKADALAGTGVQDVFVKSYLDGCSEDEFQGMFASEATRWGWEHAHCRRVKQSRKDTPHETPMPAGWPDSVCLRGGVILFAELKTDTGRPTLNQLLYARLLEEAAAANPNVVYKLWRPKHWDEIVEFLKNRRAA